MTLIPRDPLLIKTATHQWQPFTQVNAQGELFAGYLFEIGKGNIPGGKSYAIPGKKNTISSAVLDDLTEIPGVTVTTEPGGIQLEVVSTSPNDTLLGTGMRSLEMYYLDTDGLERQEIVELNGVTPVQTIATNIDFVQWAHTKTKGSSSVAEGNVSIQGVGGGTVFEYITLGGNQSLSGRFKVPSNMTGFITGWQGSGITKIVDLRLRATVDRFDRTLLDGIFLFQDLVNLNDATSGYIPFPSPLRMPGGSVIKLSAKSSAAGGNASGQFDIVLIEN